MTIIISNCLGALPPALVSPGLFRMFRCKPESRSPLAAALPVWTPPLGPGWLSGERFSTSGSNPGSVPCTFPLRSLSLTDDFPTRDLEADGGHGRRYF